MDKKCITLGSDAPKKIANTPKGLAPLRGVQQEKMKWWNAPYTPDTPKV